MARALKNSGIIWIGSIPVNWQVQRNKICFDCSKEIVGENSSSTQLLSLTTKGIKEKRAEETAGKVPESYDTYQVVVPDDIVMCLFDLDVSAVFSGKSSYYGMISPAYKVLKCIPDRIIPAFAEYWFSYIFDGRKFRHYAKNLRYTLNYDEFAVLPIVLPPVHEQKRIADFLDSVCFQIDKVIEQTRASIVEYKKLKQSVITEAVTKGIRGDRPMKDSGFEWIGKIPMDWLILRITRILDYSHPYPIGDGDHGLVKTEDYIDSGIPYIRVQNVGWATPLDLNSVVYISTEINEKIKNSVLRPGDVLFAKTGATIGKTAIVPDSLPESNTTSHVGKITVDPRYSAKYVFYVLSSFVGYKQFWDIACQKTTRPELSIEETKTIRILLPSERVEQDEIVSYLDIKCAEIDAMIEQKEHILVELQKYKKSLVYEYVTGKKEA